VCLILFQIFQFSHHISFHTSVFLIFHVFPCFSQHSSSYHVSFSFSFVSFLATFQYLQCVCFSFSTFFSFVAIFQVLQCTFLIFHVFQCFLPYSRSYYVSFTFSLLVSVLAILQVLYFAFPIFHVFHCFSPYFTS